MLGRALFAGVMAAVAAGAAQAQTAPAPAVPTPPPPPKATVVAAPVVVTAQRPLVISAIDRTIYNVSDDPMSQTGTAADVLRNLPSVDVDLNGNPALRGDGNVQILLNGQPTPLLNGPNRGAFLQSMGADAIDSIEVMTNPSVMFKPDGSAGIINIVTKKTYKPGPTGVARVNLGSEGRYNAGLSGSIAAGDTDLHAGYNVREDQRKRRSTSQRDDLDPATGQVTDSFQSVVGEGARFSQNLWAGLDHTVGKADHLSADLSWDDRHGSPESFERDVSDTTPSAGSRLGLSQNHGWDEGLDARYKHDFAGDGHQFTLRIQVDRADESDLDSYLYGYDLPPGPATAGDQTSGSREIEEQITAEYVRPMAGGAKLQAGFSLQRNDNLYENGADGVDPASGLRTPNAAMANDFSFGQWINALYGTYQFSLAKLQIQAGLRLEDTAFDIRSQTGNIGSRVNYLRLYPSLHLNYPVGSTTTLKASYSQRISRPGPDDLNPFVVVDDAFNETAGNPNLVSQVTHAFEFGWQDTDPKWSKSLNVYVRQTEATITGVSEQVSPTVLLSTKINAGGLRSVGMDGFFSGKPTETLSYNLSAYVFDNEVRASTGWFAGPKLDFGYSAKLSLNWRPTPKDLVQWTGNYASRRLMPNGYRDAGASADLGYKHDLTNRLTAVMTLSDMFESRGQKTVVNVPGFHDVYDSSQLGRTVLIGFSYRLGGGGAKKPQDERFNY